MRDLRARDGMVLQDFETPHIPELVPMQGISYCVTFSRPEATAAS